MKKIEVTNEKICNFYENNPSIDFEAVNLIFIDLFDKLLQDMNNTMNVSINSQILSNINENNSKLNEINNSITYLNDKMNSLHSDITNSLLLKFLDYKKEYIEELRTIIQINNTEKIGPLLEKNNNMLIDKTSIIINDIVPKSQTQYYSQIHESIRSFHKSISDDTRVLIKYIDNNSIKEYINNFEMKSSMMLQNIQQPIYTYIKASEDRINANIANMKENGSANNGIQNKLIGELTEFLNIYKNNQFGSQDVTNKNKINIILNKLYSTSEVVSLNNSSLNNSFSIPQNMFSRTLDNNNEIFIMKRPNKPKMIIQSVDIERNVTIDEIKDFVQLLEENNCNGIFLSHNSGFSSKPNFHIETYNKLIMVYVHNVKYSHEKIKSAIDIIDNLYLKLRELNNENEYEFTIDKEILEEINKEYQFFITQKESVINVLKDSQKKVFSQIEEFKFPALDKYLSTKFATPIHKQGFKCDLCKLFNANNLKALAAHKRGCSRKNVIVFTNNTSLEI